MQTLCAPLLAISIHAPRVGSDHTSTSTAHLTWEFQSTLPVWGATAVVGHSSIRSNISIHAPRVGSDVRPDGTLVSDYPISIHAPRVGSDPTWQSSMGLSSEFQSTLPVWGATLGHFCPYHAPVISIHAPRVGSDLRDELDTHGFLYISIHAPRVGSDCRGR